MEIATIDAASPNTVNSLVVRYTELAPDRFKNFWR
jgi:hypothetical protein